MRRGLFLLVEIGLLMLVLPLLVFMAMELAISSLLDRWMEGDK